MTIPIENKQNFETMVKACKRGDLALMEVRDRKTGDIVDAVCMVNRNPFRPEDTTYVPVAFMIREDVWDRFDPPL